MHSKSLFVCFKLDSKLPKTFEITNVMKRKIVLYKKNARNVTIILTKLQFSFIIIIKFSELFQPNVS